MARPEPRTLEVIRKQQLTPNMLRVTLGGPGLADFPADQTSAYIKLRLHDARSGRDVTRTYTVRSQRADEIDVDFALHEVCGPATLWAIAARPGDTVLVGGPGPRKLVRPDAPSYLLVGDMTALPAIAGNIELLACTARGTAVLEIMDEADMQELAAPPGLHIQWVINPHPGEAAHALLERVSSLPWPDRPPYVWAACEFSGMRLLRDYFRNERGVDTADIYISSYWKLGSDEDRHKLAKREDAEALAG